METIAAVENQPRLRPGWRIPLTVVGMFAFVGAGIATSALLSLLPVPGPAVRIATLTAMAAAAIGVVYCLRRFVDRRPWRDLGLTWRPADVLPLLLGGALAALVVLTAHLGAIALGLSDWRPTFEDGLPLIPGLLLGYLMILLGQAFPEELLWRGYLLTSLSADWRRWAAVGATALGFGAMHVISNPGTDASLGWRLLYAVMACGLGFAAASCRLRGGTIWLAVGFHAGHNLTGKVLNTGAYDWSLLVSFAVFLGFGLVMLRTAPRRSPG